MIVNNIKSALGNCKFAQRCTCEHKTPYVSTNKATFFIHDPAEKQPVVVHFNNGPYEMIVYNNNKSEVTVIKTDNCLLSEDTQKCDCIVLNDTTMYLVEIKDAKDRATARNNAISQLEATIEVLIANGIQVGKIGAKAIICFKQGKTKPTNASQNSKAAIFRSKYKVSLEEGNAIFF